MANEMRMNNELQPDMLENVIGGGGEKVYTLQLHQDRKPSPSDLLIEFEERKIDPSIFGRPCPGQISLNPYDPNADVLQ